MNFGGTLKPINCGAETAWAILRTADMNMMKLTDHINNVTQHQKRLDYALATITD